MPQLFRRRSCTGCEACSSACPNGSIGMVEACAGLHLYPRIDRDSCVECGICTRVCPSECFTREAKNPEATLDGDDPVFAGDCYAAASKDPMVLQTSSSGGAFTALANHVIAQHGSVYGCAWTGDMMPQHMRVNELSELWRLRGSKYVQSRIGDTFSRVRTDLDAGKEVLFVGTPCQVAGLRSYLRKDSKNLLTVDLVCHGVPSARFFADYLGVAFGDVEGIEDVVFRDKTQGWGCGGGAVYKRGSGGVNRTKMVSANSYYYSYFLLGLTYRDSCYECAYATPTRVGDFTLGDFWGFDAVDSQIDPRGGVSLILVNTPKAASSMPLLATDLLVEPGSFDQAARGNHQLTGPTERPDLRGELLHRWQQFGAEGLQREFVKTNRLGIAKWKCKQLLRGLLG